MNQRFVWVGHSCPTFPPLRSCGAGTPARATADGTRFPLGLVGQLSQMKDHDANRHPGLWRVMQIDSEFVGLLLAFGFLLMGLVSMPIATWFFLGALVLGGVVALLLHFIPKALFGMVMGTVIVLVGCALWWTGRPPKRPLSVSTNALHVQPNNLGFVWHRADYWVDCWFDKDAKVDRCRLTDAKGAGLFEDEFLPCVGHAPVPQDLLVLDSQRTGSIWVQSQDKRVNFPIVSLQDGQTLLPRSFYAEARRQAYCSQ